MVNEKYVYLVIDRDLGIEKGIIACFDDKVDAEALVRRSTCPWTVKEVRVWPKDTL